MSAQQRTLPPVAQLGVVTLALIVVGGIYMASHLPRHFSLAFPIADVVAAAAVMAVNVALLARVRRFAWRSFFLVGKWALAAYVVVAGMLEYVFALDHTPGSALAVLTLMLLVYAVNIPLLLAFSVARYQDPQP